MSATRLALEVTTLGNTEAALVVVCYLLHEGLTTMDQLQGRLANTFDRWPDTLSTRVVLRLADARVESPGEARTIHLCWSQGLPMPIPQYEVHDRSGALIGRVDFAWPEHKLFLEFDGRMKYSTYLRDGETPADAVFREKRREERICEATGWRCIRITWADLAHPERTAARILAMLGGLAA